MKYKCQRYRQILGMKSERECGAKLTISDLRWVRGFRSPLCNRVGLGGIVPSQFFMSMGWYHGRNLLPPTIHYEGRAWISLLTALINTANTMDAGTSDTKAPEAFGCKVSGAFLHKESMFIRFLREPLSESHSDLGIRCPEVILTVESFLQYKCLLFL